VARDSGIARRYAQALFLAAQKKDVVDRVWDDVHAVLALDPGVGLRFRQFLEAPQVPTEHKLAVIETAFRPIAHGLVVEFFRLLLRKKRMFELEAIVGEFERLVEDHRGIVRARVTSAVPLLDAELKGLVAALESGLKKNVRVVSNVDPGILGGLVLRVGDRIADQSARTMLTQLREQLLAARAT
jgi:F-type H+-transporting ATPase subunit delta